MPDRDAAPDMKDIHACVICGADLHMPRVHVDTCGKRCFKRLRDRQMAEFMKGLT